MQTRLSPMLVLGAVFLATTASTPIAASQGGEGAEWGSNYFPNVELVSHEGERLRFFDDLIRGKVVAINFIYTTCPDACPLETARLVQVQKLLGERVGKDVFFYSISIDPAVDTPEVLAEYVERYDVDPGWKFLTGDEEDITLLRKRLGLYIDEIQNGTNDHNLSLVIGNQATGRWMKRSPFENPYVLATQLGGDLHNWAVPLDLGGGDYAEAPELRSISKGESMFRTRCLGCHIVGEEDGTPRLGPDLFQVNQRRERDWLLRWIAAPDAMLAEEDPIAMGLYFAHDNVAMPNMRLTEGETQKLLEYIAQETERVTEARRLAALRSDMSGLGDEAALAGEPVEACCLKDDNVVLSSIDEIPAQQPEPEPEGPAISATSVFFGGLAWIFGLATGLLSRRSVTVA